ncbi:MAG: cytochrome c3 family protein [Methanophagales archaeon]|nr:cytochrome c3 family protein [Methanophagales archaeon]
MREKCRVWVKKIFPVMIVAVLSISLANIPIVAEDFGGCERCHKDIADDFSTSLHYTGAGMKGEYERGAAGEFGIDMDEYYAKWNCSKCHATTCTKCHIGFQFPHVMEDLSKNMTTCDQCHFKKQTSIFIGETPAHNKIPIEGPEVPHPADIHYQNGLTCTDCHTAEEMHGTGVEYSTMLEAVSVSCEDCHNSPGKTVKGMPVTQYSNDTQSHKIHGDKLDCAACHTGWAPTCVNCHLDTRKGTKVVIDDFHLAIAADGKIKPFINMTAMHDNATHTGWAEWFPHTVTNKSKDCAFCHENRAVLCEGCEGQLLGPPGASFIPQEVIDRIIGAHKPAVTVSTDKFKYSPGDTMTVTISISNPTQNNVTFQCYWGVPQYIIWVLVTSVPVPAGYDKTFNFSIPVPYLGLKPTGNVFYVQLLNTSGEVLDANAASWACSPSGEVMPPLGIMEQKNKMLSVNIGGEITKRI